MTIIVQTLDQRHYFDRLEYKVSTFNFVHNVVNCCVDRVWFSFKIEIATYLNYRQV